MSEPLHSLTNLLPKDGICNYFEDFIDPNSSTEIQKTLTREVPWRSDEIVMFGKRIAQPRLCAWFANHGISYTYSNLTLPRNDWSPTLFDLKNRVQQYLSTDFNGALLNLYRNGQDSMGWHSDDETALGRQPIIASLSFGGSRKFRLRHKGEKQIVNVTLASGSLLIMRGDTQKYWQHELPKTKKHVEPRINITFRSIQN